MAEARKAAEALLAERILKDDEMMLALRAEFKLKIDEMEVLMLAAAEEAALLLAAKDKEFVDAKALWLVHEAKQKEEYDKVIAAELGAEASLVGEVDRLKAKLKQDADAALVILEACRAEMREALARKDAEMKELVLAYEAKLEKVRSDSKDALAAERQNSGKKLAEKEAQLLAASREFKAKLQA